MKQTTKPITPFAMRCTQEQFDDVKEELKEYQIGYWIFSFIDYPILLLTDGGVTNTNESTCAEQNIIVGDWDKSLFLKMAGKPDPESRELIGYKRNSQFYITAKQLAGLIGCSEREQDGLFFLCRDVYDSLANDEFIARAIALGIVGEGKWLVPVYREEPERYDIIDLKPLPQSEVDRIKEATFIRGTPEWQKAIKDIDVTKEPISDKLLSTLNKDEVHFMAQSGRLNVIDYMRYLDLKTGNKVWNNKTDTTNMKPTQYVTRITGTYEQQKGGE